MLDFCMDGTTYHTCEVLLSISGADHIHRLCEMHFGSCAISPLLISQKGDSKPGNMREGK